MSFIKIKQLYITVNHVVAELGKDGQIDTRHALVAALNDALADIDDGEFKPDLFDKAQIKLEAMVSRITELEAQLLDAKQVANDCRIVADNAVLEALVAKVDAARYQWLRSHDDWDCSPKPIVRLYSGPDFEPAQGWELDSIIDAAMQKT